uniref:Uncharacterized protein n=2 Tax=Oryza TaxID=4527 RepID=A0A0E0R6M9_ORYRU
MPGVTIAPDRVPASFVVFQPSVHVLWGCQPVEHVMLSSPSPFPHLSSGAFLSTSVNHVKSHGKKINSAGQHCLFGHFFVYITLKIPPDSQELKWTKKAMLKLPKATFHEASHSLGWTCGRGFGQVDMIHNGGTRESSDRLALLRPSKCPTARTDQYPTGQ